MYDRKGGTLQLKVYVALKMEVKEKLVKTCYMPLMRKINE